MSDYLYHCYIYHDQTEVLDIDEATEQANTADFEANYKNQCLLINDLIPAATTFDIVKTYSQFKTLIDGDIIKWTDVKYADEGKAYDLYLITQAPL